jgi:hypothetical protein
MKQLKTRFLILVLIVAGGFAIFSNGPLNAFASADGSATPGIDNGIDPPYVSGYVRDKSSNGIYNVQVDLFGDTNATTFTDTNGYFELGVPGGLPDGTYSIRFTLTGYSFSPAEDEVTISGGTSSTYNTTGYLFTPTAIPFSDGFESGSFSDAWALETEHTGRVRIGGGYPYSGSYSLLLDDSVADPEGDDYPAAAILALNLSGREDVLLSFWIREFGNETPSNDGVHISDDNGVTWHFLYPFTSITETYSRVLINLDDAVQTAGMSFTSEFLIKFEFRDSHPIDNDGYAIDDVLVSDLTISGYAQDVSYTGIEGVTVSFGGAAPSVVTDEFGYYSQFGFAEGFHTVRFSKVGYSFKRVEYQVEAGGPHYNTTGYPFIPTSIPFSDGFEGGTFGNAWAIETDYNGRTEITSDEPYEGTNNLLIDNNINGGQDSHSAAILSLDLSGQSFINLTFWYRNFLADIDPNEEGVFISDDNGVTWAQAYSFSGVTPSYTKVTINLDYAASQAGMVFSEYFLIKFQYYGNNHYSNDGYVIDSVHVGISDNLLYLPMISK